MFRLQRASIARLAAVVVMVALYLSVTDAQPASVAAVEISAENAALLPAGKEADGIVGDFVLRNENLHILVAGNQPLRRANMGTEYPFPTPGSLYDFDLRGESNDQLTVLRPGQLGGALSWVRVAKEGRDGEGVIEAVRTAAKGEGLEVRHEYRLKSGARTLLISSTYSNQSRAAKEINPQPAWKEFSRQWRVGEVRVGDSIDPFDKTRLRVDTVCGLLAGQGDPGARRGKVILSDCSRCVFAVGRVWRVDFRFQEGRPNRGLG